VITPGVLSTLGGVVYARRRILLVVDDERPPICTACGVTMVPAALSARDARDRDWVCLECEETEERDEG
jgi:transposase